MKIKVQRLNEEAVIPVRGHEDDAGLDITATSVSIQGDLIIYGTGLAIEVPKGHVGLIACRSSIYKYDLELCNSIGILDHGYLGEVMFIFRKTKQHDPEIYKVGDRIGQLVVTKCLSGEVEVVDALRSSERGQGGWGSTGITSTTVDLTSEQKNEVENELKSKLSKYKDVENLESVSLVQDTKDFDKPIKELKSKKKTKKKK